MYIISIKFNYGAIHLLVFTWVTPEMYAYITFFIRK